MRGSEDRNSRIFLRSWSKRVHQAREWLSTMLNLLTSVVHPDDLCLWHEFIMIISLKLLDKFLQICYNSMRGSEDRNSRIFLRSWSKRVHQAREWLSTMLNLLTSVVHPDDLCLWHEFIMIISLKLLDKFLQITSSACRTPFE